MEVQAVDKIKIFSAGLGGFFTILFGKLDGLLFALIICIILDYITGVMAAVKERTLDSRTGAKGILKKIGILLIIIMVNVLDVHVFDGSGIIRNVVISFYIANEGISILENAGQLGIPLPKKLVKILNQLKDDSEADDPKEPDEEEK